MDTNKIEKATKAAGFLSGLFSGWGVPANIARVIAGAVIGAVAAALAMTQSSCTISRTTTTDGTSSTSEFRAAVTPGSDLMQVASGIFTSTSNPNNTTK